MATGCPQSTTTDSSPPAETVVPDSVKSAAEPEVAPDVKTGQDATEPPPGVGQPDAAEEGVLEKVEEPVVSLSQALSKLREEKGMPDEVKQATEEMFSQIAESGLPGEAVGLGDKAPGFTLTSVDGKEISLESRLQEGPVVLIFFRGAWCPYCNVQLRYINRLHGDFTEAGASVLAIAPDKRDNLMPENNELPSFSFPVLADAKANVAQEYGLAYELTDKLDEMYKDMGLDIQQRNEMDKPILPLAATYVIDTDGTVRWVQVDVDYTYRADPKAVLEEVRALAADKG